MNAFLTRFRARLSSTNSAFTFSTERIASHVQRGSSQIGSSTLTWQISQHRSLVASSDLSFTSTFSRSTDTVSSIWRNSITSSLTHKYGTISAIGSEPQAKERPKSSSLLNNSGQMADPRRNGQDQAYLSQSESLIVAYASKTVECGPNLLPMSSWIKTPPPSAPIHSRSTQGCCGMQASQISYHASQPTSSELSFTFSHFQLTDVDDPIWKSSSIIPSKTHRIGLISLNKSEPLPLQRPELTDLAESQYQMSNTHNKEQVPASISRDDNQVAADTSTTQRKVPAQSSMVALITASAHDPLHLKGLTPTPTYTPKSFQSNGLMADVAPSVFTSRHPSETLPLDSLLSISKAPGDGRQVHSSVETISLDLDVLDSHLDLETNDKENVGDSLFLHSLSPLKHVEQTQQMLQTQTTVGDPSVSLFISVSNSKQVGQASTLTTGFSHLRVSTDLTHTTSTTLAATLDGSGTSMPIHKKALGVILGSISSAAVVFCGIFLLHRLYIRGLPHVRKDPTYIGYEQTGLPFDDSQYREVSRFSKDS